MSPKFSIIKWEYEDSLPEMEDEMFDSIFPLSQIVGNQFGGVRMYPYVEDEEGVRIWLMAPQSS